MNPWLIVAFAGITASGILYNLILCYFPIISVIVLPRNYYLLKIGFEFGASPVSNRCIKLFLPVPWLPIKNILNIYPELYVPYLSMEVGRDFRFFDGLRFRTIEGGNLGAAGGAKVFFGELDFSLVSSSSEFCSL